MCRMCLVEVDTGRGAGAAALVHDRRSPTAWWSTPSDARKKAQDGVLEFLLINHPLDCPVCDKGGECPLQDQTLAYGPGESRFVEEKRHFEKPIPISDLVLPRPRALHPVRPLHPLRRRGRGRPADPLPSDRGDHTAGQHLPRPPVRLVLLRQHRADLPGRRAHRRAVPVQGPPLGPRPGRDHLHVVLGGLPGRGESSSQPVLRYHGVDIDPVNWGWLCDKGRFDFEAIHSDERLAVPARRARAASWSEAPWPEALDAAADGDQGRLAAGPGGVAVLGGARLTNEDAYAWAKLAKGVIGTDNVDAQLGDGLPAEVVLGLPRATIDELRAGRHRACARAGPQGGAARPVPAAAPRRRADGVKLIELTPQRRRPDRARRGSLRSARARPPGHGELWPAAASRRRRIERRRARAPRSSCWPSGPSSRRRSAGPSLAESADRSAAAADVLLAAMPEARFLPALRRGNVHGALDLGLAPGLLPGRVTPRRRPRLVRRGLGPRVPTATGPRRHRHPAGGRRRQGSTCWCCSVPTRSPTSPTGPGRPGARRRPLVIAVDLFLTESTSRGRRRPPRRRARRESPGPPPTSRAASAAGQKVSRRAPPGPTG